MFDPGDLEIGAEEPTEEPEENLDVSVEESIGLEEEIS